MATKDDDITNQEGLNVVASRVKYKEFFNLKSCYKYMHEWLVNEGWGPNTHHEFRENFILSSQRSDGEQVSWWWRLHKHGENKDLPFIKKVMDINVDCLSLKNVEKIIKGQKVKGNTGQFDMRLYGRLIYDPGGQWDQHSILKHFKTFYYKRFKKAYFDQRKLDMYREIYKFQSVIKEFFQLYHAQEKVRPFKPYKGVPQNAE